MVRFLGSFSWRQQEGIIDVREIGGGSWVDWLCIIVHGGSVARMTVVGQACAVVARFMKRWL